MVTIAARALRCIGRRFLLYAIATAVAIVAQLAIGLLWHAWSALVVATVIVPAMLSTLVYAFVDADEKHDGETPDAEIWSRVLERCWAVIVIEFAVGLIVNEAIDAGSLAGPLDLMADVLLLLLSATLIFADASATVDDGDGMLQLIPRSFARSFVFAIKRRNLYRALVLLALQVVVLFAVQALDVELTALHAGGAALWAFVPIPTIVGVPLSALTVLIYRDTGIQAT